MSIPRRHLRRLDRWLLAQLGGTGPALGSTVARYWRAVYRVQRRHER